MLPGNSRKPAYCTLGYSSSQAWNADQSLLPIAKLLHDAITTGNDTWRLVEKNSEDGEYTRQQIQTPP
jgi:hypothetical protein